MNGKTESEGIVANGDKILPEPQYMSKEQFYKRSHISKAIALWLIESGLVPAIDTHKQTNRYLISCKAVDFYLADREKNPEKYGYTFRYQKGYSKDSRKKAKERQLATIRISRKYYIPKKYLLDFVETPAFYRINNKSEFHIELLMRVSQ